MIKQERLMELFNNSLEYLVELKKRESIEDKEIFVKDILGMSESEIAFFGLDIDFLNED